MMILVASWVSIALKWLIRSTLWVCLILVLLLLLVVVSHLPLTWFVVSKRTFRAVIILTIVIKVGRVRIFIVLVVSVTI